MSVNIERDRPHPVVDRILVVEVRRRPRPYDLVDELQSTHTFDSILEVCLLDSILYPPEQCLKEPVGVGLRTPGRALAPDRLPLVLPVGIFETFVEVHGADCALVALLEIAEQPLQAFELVALPLRALGVGVGVLVDCQDVFPEFRLHEDLLEGGVDVARVAAVDDSAVALALLLVGPPGGLELPRVGLLAVAVDAQVVGQQQHSQCFEVLFVAAGQGRQQREARAPGAVVLALRGADLEVVGVLKSRHLEQHVVHGLEQRGLLGARRAHRVAEGRNFFNELCCEVQQGSEDMVLGFGRRFGHGMAADELCE
mmetsp:Transcript_532/g.886  ORF Transcript_532/g.886 Transcript_532/m.886 type:complete len:312 (-) Transcript_532:3994-4929(-)